MQTCRRPVTTSQVLLTHRREFKKYTAPVSRATHFLRIVYLRIISTSQAATCSASMHQPSEYKAFALTALPSVLVLFHARWKCHSVWSATVSSLEDNKLWNVMDVVAGVIDSVRKVRVCRLNCHQ